MNKETQRLIDAVERQRKFFYVPVYEYEVSSGYYIRYILSNLYDQAFSDLENKDKIKLRMEEFINNNWGTENGITLRKNE